MLQRKVMLIVLFTCFFSCSQIGVLEKDKKTEKVEFDQGLTDLSLKLKPTKVVLDNGLKLLVLEDHRLPIMSYYTFYDVGGRYEYKGITGATHFLEHLMFKGAKKYGAGMFDSMIEGSGGRTNAYTTFDSTVYYNNVPSSMLTKIIDLEADRMNNLLLDPVAFEKERQVVLEERKMRYENSPKGKLYLKMMQAVFEKTPYGLSVIGDEEDVKALSRDTVHDYFKKFYAPNNATVVIAGDVYADEVIARVKDYYGVIPRSKTVEETKKNMDDPKRFAHQGRYKREIKLHGTNTTPYFMIAYQGEPLGKRKGNVMDILSSVLGDGQSSYFHQRFVKSRRPLLNSISASNYTLRNNGVFFISGELLKRTGIRQFKRAFHKTARMLCDNAINERTLQKTKNQYLYGYYNAIKTNAGAASFIGLNELFFDDYEYYKKELAIYESITVEELKAVCHEVFDGNKNIFVTIWNKNPRSKKRK